MTTGLVVALVIYKLIIIGLLVDNSKLRRKLKSYEARAFSNFSKADE